MGGGAWPFLVGGVICLVNSDNERDSGLLTSRWAQKDRPVPLVLPRVSEGRSSRGGRVCGRLSTVNCMTEVAAAEGLQYRGGLWLGRRGAVGSLAVFCRLSLPP